MRRPIFYGWIIVAITALVLLATAGVYVAAFVAAGWIAIIAGFAALGIRRRAPAVEPIPAAAA